MENASEKTANQLYLESGSTLKFTDWIAAEKEKAYFIKNDSLSSIMSDTLSNLESPAKKTTDNSKKILGLSKNVLVFSGIIIFAAIAYKFYKNKQQS